MAARKCNSLPYLDFQTIKSLMKKIWASLVANFGEDCSEASESKIDHLNSYKIILFTCLIGGLLIWTTYTAFLVSQLSIHVIKHPFDDLDSLSKSNYL